MTMSPRRVGHIIYRLVSLYFGLFTFGWAMAMMVRAGVGLDPWTVFAEGLYVTTGIGMGWWVVIIGLAVLLLWIPLGQRPGFGTVFNALLVGPSMEVGFLFIETPESLVQQWITFLTGVLMLAVASGFYIGARFGPGPRDGLMTGANKKFGWPIWIVRTSIEVTVLIIGVILGGTFGWGTIVFALAIGPLVHRTIPAMTIAVYSEKDTGK
ncbi:MAG: YczE/YyaS/YitT family protein [Pontimonas sp.]